MNPNSSPTKSQGMSSTTKVLLGCGCLGLLAVFVAGIVLSVGTYMAASKVKSEFEKASNQIENSPEFSSSTTSPGSSKKANQAKEKDANLNPVDWANSPLKKSDIDNYLSFKKAWAKTGSSTNVEKGHKALKALDEKGGKAGVMDSLRAINAAKDIAVGIGKANKDGERIAAQYGGTSKLFMDYVHLMALVGIAEELGKASKSKPSSDKVAQSMLEKKKEAEQKYATWRKGMKAQVQMMKSLQKKQGEDPTQMFKDPKFKKLSKQWQQVAKIQSKQPGMLLLGRAPEGSLQTWKGLDESTRLELIQKHKDIPFGSVIGLGTSLGTSVVMYSPHTIVNLEYSTMMKDDAQ